LEKEFDLEDQLLAFITVVYAVMERGFINNIWMLGKNGYHQTVPVEQPTEIWEEDVLIRKEAKKLPPRQLRESRAHV
jgi:hypothetical protein